MIRGAAVLLFGMGLGIVVGGATGGAIGYFIGMSDAEDLNRFSTPMGDNESEVTGTPINNTGEVNDGGS